MKAEFSREDAEETDADTTDSEGEDTAVYAECSICGEGKRSFADKCSTIDDDCDNI